LAHHHCEGLFSDIATGKAARQIVTQMIAIFSEKRIPGEYLNTFSDHKYARVRIPR